MRQSSTSGRYPRNLLLPYVPDEPASDPLCRYSRRYLTGVFTDSSSSTAVWFLLLPWFFILPGAGDDAERAYFANIAAIIAAMAVSFVVAILLKASKVKEDDIDAATRRVQDMAESKARLLRAVCRCRGLAITSHVRKSLVACCDTGIGSNAARFAEVLRKVQDAGLEQHLGHQLRHQQPAGCRHGHHPIATLPAGDAPGATIPAYFMTNFDGGLYTNLTRRSGCGPAPCPTTSQVTDSHEDSDGADTTCLSGRRITSSSVAKRPPKKAIRFAGEQLVKGGYVRPEYVQAMLDRGDLHLSRQSPSRYRRPSKRKDRVLATVVVSATGIRKASLWRGKDDIARLVISIAARNNEHSGYPPA